MPLKTIRPATSSDEIALIGLWKDCGLVASYNDPAKDFHFARAKENSDVLVGIGADDSVLGSVMVGHDGRRGWIYYVAASSHHRKQGIGRSMVKAAERWLKDKGIVKAMLLVRDTNTQVVDFYKNIGFEAIPRVIMQKWLADE